MAEQDGYRQISTGQLRVRKTPSTALPHHHFQYRGVPIAPHDAQVSFMRLCDVQNALRRGVIRLFVRKLPVYRAFINIGGFYHRSVYGSIFCPRLLL